MSFFRKKYITSDWKKILETAIYGTVTISVMVLCVILMADCQDIPTYTEDELKEETTDMYNNWICGED